MLLLYRNITPNIDDSVHYLCDYKVLKAKLVSNLLQQFELKTYEINSNIIKVALGKNITIENYKTITYAINELTGICYFVKDSELRSNFVILYCEVDLRGTYIDKAEIKNIHVTKCNRLIGTGYYDEPQAVAEITRNRFHIPTEQEHYAHNDMTTYDNVYAVFVIEYQQIIDQKKINVNGIYAIPLLNIYTIVNGRNENKYAEVNPLDMVTSTINGCYGLLFNNNNYNLVVKKLYILPKDFLIFEPTEKSLTFKSTSIYGTDLIFNAYKLTYGHREVQRKIKTEPNYMYYVGTPYEGVQINNSNSEQTIIYGCTTNVDSIQVVVSQGNNQRDITSNFTTSLNATYKTETSLEKMSEYFGFFVNSASALFKGDITNVVGNSLSFATMQEQKNYKNRLQVGGGNALVNYYTYGNPKLGEGLTLPFAYTSYKSVNDEEMSTKREGLNFDIYFDNIYDIFSYDFVNYDRQFSYTYLKCSADISAIPLVAINLIKSKLNKGIYLQWI